MFDDKKKKKQKPAVDEIDEQMREIGLIRDEKPTPTMGGGAMTAKEIDELLSSEHGEKFRKFFDAVKWAEGGQPNLIVGGKLTFDPNGDHPNIVGLRTDEGPSTAAGNFQMTGSNWYGTSKSVGLKKRLGAKNFNEENQLRAAIMLFGDRDNKAGIKAILNDDYETAIRIAAKDWAAVPGSTLHKNISGRRREDFLKRLNAGNSQPTAKKFDFDKFAEDLLGGTSPVKTKTGSTPTNPTGAILPFEDKQELIQQPDDNGYSDYLAFTKKADSEDTKREYAELLAKADTEDFGERETQVSELQNGTGWKTEYVQPQVEQPQVTSNQSQVPGVQQNGQIQPQIQPQEKASVTFAPSDKESKKELRALNLAENESRDFVRKYKTRPSFEKVYEDSVIATYGAKAFEASKAFREITGEDLFSVNAASKGWYDKAPDKFYNSKTGAIQNITANFSANRKKLIDAYSRGGKDALAAELGMQESMIQANFNDSREKAEETRAKEKTLAQISNPNLSDSIWQQAEKTASASVTPFGMFRKAFDDITNSGSTREEFIAKEVDQIEKQFGTFKNYQDTQDYYNKMGYDETAARMAVNVGRGFVQTAVSGVLKGADFLDYFNENYNPFIAHLPENLRPSLRNAGNALAYTLAYLKDPRTANNLKLAGAKDDIDKRAIYQMGKYIDDSMGEDEVLKEHFTGVFSQAVGSGLGFLLMGMIAPQASITTRLGEYSLSSAGLGAVTMAGSGYDDAKKSGLSETEAKTYGVISGILGATEGFGIGAAISKSIKDETLRRSFLNNFVGFLKEKGKTFANGAVEETLQEFVQSAGGKIALDALKDKEPSAFQKIANIIKRLPTQIGEIAVENLPAAALTGGAMDLGANIAYGQTEQAESDEMQVDEGDWRDQINFRQEEAQTAPPVEERDVTLKAQRAAMLDKKLDAAVGVLYTDGERIPDIEHAWIKEVSTPDGVLHVSIPKLKKFYEIRFPGEEFNSAEAIADLESGKLNVTEVIGGKVKNFENTAGGTAVVTVDKDGNELVATKISDNLPEALSEDERELFNRQAALDLQRFGGKVKSYLVPTDEVAKARIENRPINKKVNRLVIEPPVARAASDKKTSSTKLSPNGFEEADSGKSNLPENNGESELPKNGTKENQNSAVVDLIDKYKIQTGKSVDEIFNEEKTHLRETLDAGATWEFAAVRTDEIDAEIKELKKTMSSAGKAKKAEIKQQIEALQAESNSITAAVHSVQERFMDELVDKLIERAEKKGYELEEFDRDDLSEFAIPYLTDGRYMENIFNKRSVQELSDELIEEYFTNKNEESEGDEKEEKPSNDDSAQIKNKKSPLPKDLVIPEEIDLPIKQFKVFKENKKELEAQGWKIKALGDTRVEIHRIPDEFDFENIPSYFDKALSKFKPSEDTKTDEPKKAKKIKPVKLDAPVLVELRKRDSNLAKKNKKRLARLGFDFVRTGEKNIKVTHAPAGMPAANIESEFAAAIQQSEIDRIAARKPVEMRKADPKRDSLFDYVFYSGGIRPSKSADTSKLRGLKKGIIPILRENGRDLADAMRSALTDGYLVGIANMQQGSDGENYDRSAFTENDFVDAVEYDARQRGVYYSIENIEETGEESIAEAEARYYDEKEKKGKAVWELEDLTEDEFLTVSTVEDFFTHVEVREILAVLETDGEISDAQREILIEIGHYTYEFERNEIREIIRELEENARQGRGASRASSEETPGTLDERAPAGNQNSQESIFQEEEIDVIDESEPDDDDDVDLSFDFSDEEESEKPAESLPEKSAEKDEKPVKEETAQVLKMLSEAPSVDELLARPYEDAEKEIFHFDKSPKDAKKRKAKLEQILEKAESELIRSTRIFNKYLEADAELIEKTPDWNSVQTNLSLVTNHITFHKREINAALELLGREKRFEAGDSPRLVVYTLEWAYPEKTKKEEEKDDEETFKFSSAQVNLPSELADKIREFGRKLIPQSELAEDGYEENPHITVKYGIHSDAADELRELLKDEKPFEIRLGYTAIFDGEKSGSDFDVVYLEVYSYDIHNLNKKISKNLKVTDTFKTYTPHITLAYVKKGEAKKYIGNKTFLDQNIKITFDSVVFSSKNGEKTEIPLSAESSSATDAAHDAATSPQNDLAAPTEAQIEAGNYKKGHITIGGVNISVENPVGSERKGTDRDGKAWSVTMQHHYGYVKRSVGADKENIDIFVKDGTPIDFSGDVFVVDQVHPDTGEFDEHKVMLGFESEEEARTAYAANYAKDWKGLKDIAVMPFAEFKTWLETEQSEPAAKSLLSPGDSFKITDGGDSFIVLPGASAPNLVKILNQDAGEITEREFTQEEIDDFDVLDRAKELTADILPKPQPKKTDKSPALTKNDISRFESDFLQLRENRITKQKFTDRLIEDLIPIFGDTSAVKLAAGRIASMTVLGIKEANISSFGFSVDGITKIVKEEEQKAAEREDEKSRQAGLFGDIDVPGVTGVSAHQQFKAKVKKFIELQDEARNSTEGGAIEFIHSWADNHSRYQKNARLERAMKIVVEMVDDIAKLEPDARHLLILQIEKIGQLLAHIKKELSPQGRRLAPNLEPRVMSEFKHGPAHFDFERFKTRLAEEIDELLKQQSENEKAAQPHDGEWLKKVVNIGRDDVFALLEEPLKIEVLAKLNELKTLLEREPKKHEGAWNEYSTHKGSITGTLVRYLRKKFAVEKGHKTASPEAVQTALNELHELLAAENGKDGIKENELSILDEPLSAEALADFAAGFPAAETIEPRENKKFPDRIVDGGKYIENLPERRTERDALLNRVLANAKEHLKEMIAGYNELRANPAAGLDEIKLKAWKNRRDLVIQSELKNRVSWIATGKGNIQRIERLLAEPSDDAGIKGSLFKEEKPDKADTDLESIFDEALADERAEQAAPEEKPTQTTPVPPTPPSAPTNLFGEQTEQTGFGFMDAGGLFSAGGPKVVEAPADNSNQKDKAKRLAELAAKTSKIEQEQIKQAYGEQTGEYLNTLKKSNIPEVVEVAKTLINTRNLVLDKGVVANRLVESAADALDVFVKAKEQEQSVEEVLKQPRLDGNDFSQVAKNFARSMEKGDFGQEFRKALNIFKNSRPEEKPIESQELKLSDLKKGDEVVFSKDFDYLTAGEIYTIEEVGKKQIYFRNKQSGGGTYLRQFQVQDAITNGILSRAESPSEKTAGENLKDAATDAKSGLDAAIKGLANLFGDDKFQPSVFPAFDEKKYAEAKPHFIEAYKHFASSVSNVKEAMRKLIQSMNQKGVSLDAIEKMKPYFVRFMKDVDNGSIIFEGEQENAAEPERRDSETDSERGSENELRGKISDAESGRSDEIVPTPGGVSEGTENRPDGYHSLYGTSAAPGGTRSNIEIRGEESDDSSDTSGNSLDGRSSFFGSSGTLFDYQPSGSVRELAETSGNRLTEKQRLQAEAEDVSVELQNLENIRASLPFLLPEQQEDVLKAENRFEKGAGILFTNGTGTGKTYTGLGVVKRFAKQNKNNILIVAPNDKIIEDWQTSGKNLLLDAKRLADTKDNGKSGIVVTTYANFGQNPSLIKRKWDLIVFDESHYLSQNQDGDLTASAKMLRAVALHHEGEWHYTSQALFSEYAAKDELVAEKNLIKNKGKNATLEEFDRLEQINSELEEMREVLNEKQKHFREEFKTRRKEETRPKVVFLSATPFAYQKSLEYAEGFLFSYGPEVDSGSYNSGDNRERFMMQHFGYRMRYNKLTRPDADVNQELMEQQFNTFLKKEGSLSGRRLSIEADYSRTFILTESAIGAKIDEGFNYLWESKDEDYRDLREFFRKRFDYLHKRYILEAINARESIAIVKAHLAMGRKVVVFHDFNKNESFHPFKAPPTGAVNLSKYYSANLTDAYNKFASERPDLVNLDLRGLVSPREIYAHYFGDQVKFFNGLQNNKENRAAVHSFNDDDSNTKILLSQSDKGREGISLHDTTGKHPRVLINLGLPVRPIAAIQTEGRIYRTNTVTNAVQLYMTTGTSFERYAFGTTISQRSSTAENLALGEEARALKQAFIEGYETAVEGYEPFDGEGTGGKEADRAAVRVVSEFERAKSYYFGNGKKTSKNKSREGKDYFATPEPVGLKMVEWANQQLAEDALEPSAGHGAIARFFRVDNRKTFLEPSGELTSRLSLWTDGRIEQDYFENHHIVNKYHTIVMNPPFGVGGKTAMEHLEKAVSHLRDGGRIVALIPSGPMADKRFENFLYENDKTKDIYLIGDVQMPSVTFERAGTSVRTHIVILEKQATEEGKNKLPQARNLDFTHIEKINELFDRIENIEFSGRAIPPEAEEPETATAAPSSQATFAGEAQDFKTFEFNHTKTGDKIFAAKLAGNVEYDVFKQVEQIAKKHGGYYSRFKVAGIDKGFYFKTEEARASFLAEAGGMNDGIKPLYKIRDEKSETELTRELPKAHFQDVIEGMNSRIVGEDLELQPHDAEMLRRAIAEIRFRETDEERDESAFDGILFRSNDFSLVSRMLNETLRDARRAGYSQKQLEGLEKLIDNLEKLSEINKGIGALYVFDDALPEEKFHQEDMRAGNTDAAAIEEIKESEFWTAAQTGAFNKGYGHLTEDDKISELAAKLATGQFERFGFDKIPDFEKKAKALLIVWAEGVLRRNTDADGNLNFDFKKFERIAKYAKLTETYRGRNSGNRTGGRRIDSKARNSEGKSEENGIPDGQTGENSTPSKPAKPSNRSAAENSRREIEEEAEALGVTPAEVKTKNRKFAETLRENGRDALDVPYFPESEKQWIDEAKAILQESRDAADETGASDYERAIDIFESKDIKPSTKTALGIALIDHLGAAGEYTQMFEVATTTVNHVGTAAQAMRASQLVSKYDFAKGVQLATKALEERGKSLTEKEVDLIRELTEKYAASERERALLEIALKQAREIITELEEEIEEINEALGDKEIEIGLSRKTIENLKRQVERWKNKVLSEKQTATRISKTHKQLLDRKPAILAKLQEKFPGSMSLLKSVAAEQLDDEAIQFLTEYAALQIFDSMPYEELIPHLKEVAGTTLTDDEIGQIHSDAYLMTRGENVKSDEMKARLKVRNHHKAKADAYRKQKNGTNLNRVEREILDQAGDDKQLGKAAIFLNRAKNKDDWFAQIKIEFPELTNEDLDKLFVKARDLRSSARRALEKLRAEKRADKEMSEREFEAFQEKARIARTNALKNRQTLDIYYKNLQKGAGDKVMNVLQQVTGVFKGLSATGELSMILRQNGLLWLTHPLKTARALEGAGRGLLTEFAGVEANLTEDTKFGNLLDAVGMASEQQFLKYLEKMRAHSFFSDAQHHGLEFSEIGDFNIADEHFVSTLFNAFADARKLWKVENGAVNAAANMALMPVRVFGRTYKALELANTLFGDQARLETYAYYAAYLDSLALTPAEKSQAKKYAATVVNRFSGRGDIKGVLGSNGALSKLANMSFFSLRLLLSRPQSMYHLTTGFALAPKGMRAHMAAEGIKFYSFLVLLMMLAGLRLDPDDDDFGKIKYKGKDYNFDVLAGMDAPTQWMFGTAAGTFKAIYRRDSEPMKHSFEKLFSKYWYNADMAKKDDNWLSGLRYWRGKSSPAVSLGFDYFSGKDFIGRPFGWWNALTSRMTPLAYQQTYDALYYDRYASVMKEPSVATGDLDVLNGLIVALTTGIGIGITQYINPDSTKAELAAWDMYEPTGKSKKSPEQKRIEIGLRNLFRIRKEMLEGGKPIEKIDEAISKFAEKYELEKKALAELKSQGEEGKFKFVTKQLSVEEVEKILAVATDGEKPELEKILASKRENREKRETPKSLAVRLSRADVADAVKLWNDYSDTLDAKQKLEFKTKLRLKTINSNRDRTLSKENYDAVRRIIEFNVPFREPRKKAEKVKGLNSMKNTY